MNCPDHHNNSQTPVKPTLLLVDDDSELLEILSSLLSEKYQVLSATTGGQAIRTVEQEEIDLILLDVEMPTTNGYEVCRRLKSSQATVAIPIIFVTARVGIEDEIRGLRLGAVDYVLKPVKLPVLEARIKYHLEAARHLKAVEIASRTDALTGLANRLQLQETLDRQIQQ